jgi:hypothetical protein
LTVLETKFLERNLVSKEGVFIMATLAQLTTRQC